MAPHCLENSVPVKGLEEGKQYEFRVTAENLHGYSEPLTTNEPVTAKWPFSNFILVNKIDLNMFLINLKQFRPTWSNWYTKLC